MSRADKLSPKDVSMRFHVEKVERWRELTLEIPSLQFPDHWNVQMIPPFAGAIVRFQVALEPIKGDGEFPNSKISVYLDVYERLGYGGGPYWEVYPYPHKNEFTGGVDYDTFRCDMRETNTLLGAIAVALDGEPVESDEDSPENYNYSWTDDEE